MRTQDGFEIAEADLKLRGPGDLMGKQQSGLLQTRIADIVRDSDLLYQTRQAVRALLRADPELKAPENRLIRDAFQELQRENLKWNPIS